MVIVHKYHGMPHLCIVLVEGHAQLKKCFTCYVFGIASDCGDLGTQRRISYTKLIWAYFITKISTLAAIFRPYHLYASLYLVIRKSVDERCYLVPP